MLNNKKNNKELKDTIVLLIKQIESLGYTVDGFFRKWNNKHTKILII